jgi:hypothetical protein
VKARATRTTTLFGSPAQANGQRASVQRFVHLLEVDRLQLAKLAGVTVQDSYNLRGDRGLSDFDVRHRFVISGLYELPFKGNQFKEGWQLSFIEQSQGGNPVTFAGR